MTTIGNEKVYLSQEQEATIKKAFHTWRKSFCRSQGWPGAESAIGLLVMRNRPFRLAVKGRTQALLAKNVNASAATINRLLKYGGIGCNYDLAKRLDNELGGGVDLWVETSNSNYTYAASMLETRRKLYAQWQAHDEDDDVITKALGLVLSHARTPSNVVAQS